MTAWPKSWLVRTKRREILGPYSIQELARKILRREILLDDEVALPAHKWRPIQLIPDFSDLVAKVIPHAVEEKTMDLAEVTQVLTTRGAVKKTAEKPRTLVWAVGWGTAIGVALMTYFFWPAPEKPRVVMTPPEKTERVPFTDPRLALLEETFQKSNILFFQGRQYENVGGLEQAYKLYEQAQQLEPSAERPRFHLAVLNYFYKGKIEGVRSELEKLRREGTLPAKELSEILNHLGMIHFREGQWQQALQYFDEALNRESRHAPALFNRGWVLAQRRNYDEALVFMDRVAEVEPNFFFISFTLGEIYRDLGSLQSEPEQKIKYFKKALEQFKKSQAENKNSLEARLHEADLWFRIGEKEKGRQALQPIAELDFDYSRYLFIPLSYLYQPTPLPRLIGLLQGIAPSPSPLEQAILGALYFLNQEDGLAVETVERGLAAVKEGPSSHLLQNMLAWIELKKGNLSAAEERLKVVVKNKPQDVRGHLLLGEIHYVRGRYVEAMSQFQQAAKLDSIVSQPHLWLGETYLKLQKPKEAAQSFQQALSRDPHLAYARRKLLEISDETAPLKPLPAD